MSATLIVGPAWIGDMVMAHCLVQKIYAAHGERPIVMLAPPATAPIAQRMAEVERVEVLATKHGELGLGKRYRLGRQLAHGNFSRSYVLPNSWKSALVPFFARIPKRTGWLGEARYGLLNDTSPVPEARLPLMIERFMGLESRGSELHKPYPQPRLSVDAEQQQKLIQRFQLSSSSDAVALSPGAEFGPAKRWPVGHFVEVASQVIDEGRQVWLLGGPADRAVCEEIATALGDVSDGVKNLAGQTSLTEVVDVLAAAAVAVCNDSGLMHVACAVDTPAVALYGSTSPGFTPPLHEEARALTLVDLDGGANRLECQPCFARECRYGHGNCLEFLTPSYVLAELANLNVLAGKSGS